MTQPFCVLPFIQFANNVEGMYQACCISNVTEYDIAKLKPMDFFNSEYMKGLRKDMLSDKVTTRINGTCTKCLFNEKVSGTSKRTKNNEEVTIPDDIIQKALNEEDIVPKEIEYLKLKIYGNKCNLRCYMCSPTSSSKVAADWKKHGEWNRPAIINPFLRMDKDFLYEGIEEVLPYLDMLELVGGEPFMFPELEGFMKWIIEKGYAENLKLRFITNGTRTNQKIFDLFDEFKRIEIILSVDAYGKKDDYIRDLSNWNTKLKFLDMCLKNKKIKMSYSNTYTWMNIGHLPELWKFFYDEYGIEMRLNNPVSYPPYFAAVHLPHDIKQYYIENMYTFEFTNKESLMQTLTTYGDPWMFERGMKRVKQLDKRRNRSLLDEFPEFEKYYNEA